MNWNGLLTHLWFTVNDWWPRVATWGVILGGVWAMFLRFKDGAGTLYFRNTMLGKEKDKAEEGLMTTLRKMVDLEKEHHVAEVALVRTQVAEALAEKDLELAKLRAECQALRAEVAALRASLEEVARGELAAFDRREGADRGGSSADRVPGGGDHGV